MMSDEARKDDSAKPRMDLIPPEALVARFRDSFSAAGTMLREAGVEVRLVYPSAARHG